MATEVIRRRRDGILSETVHAWHYRKEGPGDPGGRTYEVLYTRTGAALIDVSGCWASTLHRVWVPAAEMRPREEWLAWLAETGQAVAEPRWCVADGREIDQDSNPEFDENCCSVECRIEMRPDF
jgi:hypothetical protein